ncbi:MAG: hypothetical protein FI675_01820 [SAR202 cluster bacterium]|nr:hypothetical protein [SAR202 cluster bacterium]|tara:strand:- start:532 stop:966 length:435 start_codon:yes stop_codon:yes gene_type:complete
MNFIDIISPKKHGKKRFTPSFFAKSIFVISIIIFCFFVFVSTLLWQDDTELMVVIPTRTGEEVIYEVRNYLDNKKYISDSFQNESCGELFNEGFFTAEYLLYGSWRVNSFHDRIRYFWRVDDGTLDVRKDYTFDYARRGISVSC